MINLSNKNVNLEDILNVIKDLQDNSKKIDEVNLILHNFEDNHHDNIYKIYQKCNELINSKSNNDIFKDIKNIESQLIKEQETILKKVDKITSQIEDIQYLLSKTKESTSNAIDNLLNC